MQPHELAIEKSATSSWAMRRLQITALLALALVAAVLYTYRELFERSFAADDYEWLLNVRDLSFGQVVRRGFDFGAQSHFYRPLVWLLLWAEHRAFGLDPRGFHAVSLALHLLNAGLAGWLAGRLTEDRRPRTKDQAPIASSLVVGLWSLLPAAIVALHPAPFEAVVWISAQSELLAAALLLVALHLWLPGRKTNDEGPSADVPLGVRFWSSVFDLRSVLATLALALALLAKESAVIGLPLLALLGLSTSRQTGRPLAERFAPYLLPTLVTLAYLTVQVAVERRNYVLQEGIYGFGPQIILNPLRGLALLVAPLPGTEHADNPWLVRLGIVVALLLVFWILDFRFWKRRNPQSKIQNPKSKIALALALTLLPTAPFVAPPNSRYLYLPVIAGALLLGVALALASWQSSSLVATNHQATKPPRSNFKLGGLVPWWLAKALLIIGFVLAGRFAVGELHIREWRFGTGAAGPAGSLWRLASSFCGEGHPDRVLVVEPPLAPQHAGAIVELSCGPDVDTRVVGRDQVDGAIEGHTVVVEFPGGGAQVARRT
jgi:hypothetical protein